MSWQPIKSAPKDGTSVFLLERYSDYPFVGRWVTFERGGGEWRADTQHISANADAMLTNYFEQSGVTHWHPIMELPE